jgi:hypothetical protein
MSSLGDIQQIYTTLMRIDDLLEKVTEKSETFKNEAGHATGALRELEYVSYRLISIFSRLGLPPQIDEAISKVQRLILVIRMLHSASMLFELSTPYGWILGGITLAGAAIGVGSMIPSASDVVVEMS